MYILGDTTYGSCCVDQVAADHLSSDVVVHYGRSCLSPNTRIPVINVFGKMPIDVDVASRSILEVLNANEDRGENQNQVRIRIRKA